MPNITQIPAPRVNIVDEKTGLISREWFRFLNNIYTIVGGENRGVILPENGGTGTGVVPTNGQLPIGNGATYTPANLTQGTGLTVTNGAGSVALAITDTGVTAGAYGSASAVPNYSVNAQGQLTAAANTSIAIDASQVISGIFPIARGGTNTNATPTAGTVTYGTGTAIAYSAVGTAGQALVSNGASAPSWSSITSSQWVTSGANIYYTAGNVGIGTTSPGSALDVKGTLRLSGSSSGYIGLAPAASAGSTTYTLPSADGSSNQVLQTNGSGVLSWGTSGLGTVTSVSGTGTVSGINLSGTVTTSGSLTLGGTLSVAASDITSGTINTARLGSGTASSSTYLRGDQTWASVTATTAVNLSGGTLTTSSYTLVSSNNLIALQSSAGNGVFVNGSGASFSGSSDNAISLGTSGFRWSALYVAGTFGWGGYSISAPAGSTSTFLRNDGTWATPTSSGVTSVSGTGTVSGLTLSGTVTSTGNLTLGGTLSLTSGNVTTALGFTPYSNTNPNGYINSSGSCASASTAANLSGGTLTTSSYTLTSSNALVAIGNSSGQGVFVNGSGSFSSSVDNTMSCGTSGFRWTTVYATTSTINTSDANQKQQIENLTDVEFAVANELKSKVKTFKFNEAVAAKGSNARKHVGWIAQDVQTVFANHGLNANDYGMFCSDEIDGKIQLGVRYEELLTFISAAEDQKMTSLISSVSQLVAEVEALKTSQLPK